MHGSDPRSELGGTPVLLRRRRRKKKLWETGDGEPGDRDRDRRLEWWRHGPSN